ncbi:MAG: TIGR02302 family protein [Pseudolabrys sp.]
MGGLDELPRNKWLLASQLKRALRRAQGSILWEGLWPALASFANALGLFLAFSWAGLWIALPPLGRIVALALFGLFALAAAIPLLLLRLPSVDDGLRRLDRGSGEPHRPATAIADEIAANKADTVSQALWRAHIERSLLAARKLKAGWPSPRLALRDPMAFRALTLILVSATFFAASGERYKRVAAAFDFQGVVTPSNFRIDAWVTPPIYTGRAPVMLPGMRPGEAVQVAGPVAVPVGSQLVVRSTGNVHFEIQRKGGIEDAPVEARAPLPAGAQEFRFAIKSDGAATLHGVGRNDLTWSFTAIADAPPIISLIRDPERQARGALRLDYRLEDDYGVVGAEATFAAKNKDKSGDTSGNAPHSLFEAPSFNLVLPQARTRGGTAQTTHDLTEHPWAGAEVAMTLVARDEAGNEGRSEPHEFELPQRIFLKPIARALIEQRRILALDADDKLLVEAALDALTLAPDRFIPETAVYLGLRSIYFQLANARNDDAMREVVARMWQMAVQIEDGNISDAQQRLRQAQENLRQALERGANDNEIKKLTDELRAALDKFMQALAEEMRKNPQQLARPLDRNTRTMTPQDLKNMIDRLENLARSGNKDAARRLLEELQSMLENLQTAQRGDQQSGDDDDDMMSALDDLGDMIRKQQQLRDKTFREGQDMKRDRQRGDRQLDDLRQDQQSLRDRLNKLLEQLKQRGMGDPQQGQKGEKGQRGQGQGPMDQLGDAGEAMGDAEGQLGDGNADGAVGSQGRALEALRKGTQGMAQAMQQNGTIGPGPNGRPGRGQARAQNDTDPLGRPLRGHDYGDDVTVKVPGEIDAQRARRILEELRRRFGDPGRPQLELDYIERLLKDF